MIIKKPFAIESIEKSTPDVTVFRFRSKENLRVDFISGMFAMLYYKDSVNGEEIGRAFSIANSPPSDYLEFMIAMIHGKLTSKLETAKIGDLYSVSAPYGQFKFNIDEGAKFLFLAGGTGIAPFFSMLRFVKSTGKNIDANMIYSIRYPYEIIEKRELDALSSDASLKFRISVTVTRPQPNDGWTGLTGHVNADMIKQCAPDFAERICYICGPPAFVKALKDALVSLGVNERSIKAEMWGE